MGTLGKVSNAHTTSDEWQRVSLTCGVELHYRSATTPEQAREIAGVIADATRLLSGKASLKNMPTNTKWIGSLQWL